MDGLGQDLRYAWRTLRLHPVFTAVVVVTLAAGIGLNSAVFSLVSALLLRPPPVAAPERLVNVYSSVPGGFLAHAPMSFPDYRDLGERARSFSELAAYAWYPLAIESGGEAELVIGELVTGRYFETLGVAPVLGRALTAADDRRGAARAVVVLSHHAWQQRFAGDPEVLGRDLRLNGRDFTIVGVAPPAFSGLVPGLAPELWLPLHAGAALPTGITINFGAATPGMARVDDRARRWVWVVGRLRHGASAETADAELRALAAEVAGEHPATNAHLGFTGVPASAVRLLPGVDRALWAGSAAALAVVGLVLTLACVNLAGLFLARALRRRREIATRLALGAGRGRLVRQLFTEGAILAAVGGAAGLAVAAVSNALLARVELPVEHQPLDLALEPALDARVLLFTLCAAVLAAVVFALLPALESTRYELAGALRELGGSASSAPRRRMREALVAAQVALAVLLLVAAGIALRSLVSASRVDPGLDAEGVAVATLAPELLGYDAPESARFFDRLLERAEALPGVRSATLASHLPLTFAINFAAVAAEAGEAEPVERWPAADAASVGPGYFETLGIEIVAGRGIEERDGAESEPVVVVNETLARRLWPGGEAVGERLRLAGVEGSLRVVGVAADGKYRTLGEAPRPFLYRSLGQDPRGTRTLAVRFEGETRPVLAAIHAEARSLDARVPVGGLQSFEEAISGVLLLPRLVAFLLGLFGALGLFLVAVGIYGVVAYVAGGRIREVGLRMALGARRVDVLRWLLGRGLAPVALGLVVGLLAAAGAGRGLGAVLHGVGTGDPLTYLAVAALLALVALAAGLLPARRAAALDPATALRHE